MTVKSAKNGSTPSTLSRLVYLHLLYPGESDHRRNSSAPFCQVPTLSWILYVAKHRTPMATCPTEICLMCSFRMKWLGYQNEICRIWLVLYTNQPCSLHTCLSVLDYRKNPKHPETVSVSMTDGPTGWRTIVPCYFSIAEWSDARSDCPSCLQPSEMCVCYKVGPTCNWYMSVEHCMWWVSPE